MECHFKSLGLLEYCSKILSEEVVEVDVDIWALYVKFSAVIMYVLISCFVRQGPDSGWVSDGRGLCRKVCKCSGSQANRNYDDEEGESSWLC